jgi:hypothetical protein
VLLLTKSVTQGVDIMPYVKCSDCKTMVHFKPIDLTEFNKRFIEGNEPAYCLNCFKKREKECNN